MGKNKDLSAAEKLFPEDLLFNRSMAVKNMSVKERIDRCRSFYNQLVNQDSKKTINGLIDSIHTESPTPDELRLLQQLEKYIKDCDL